MVEARYVCANCEARFSTEVASADAAASRLKCASCGGEGKLRECFDPMATVKDEPTTWPVFLGMELIWWVIIIATSGAGAVALCR